MPKLIRRPFKGCLAYEWQVGGLVIQFYHKVGRDICRGNWQFTKGIGALRFWHDTSWRW